MSDETDRQVQGACRETTFKRQERKTGPKQCKKHCCFGPCRNPGLITYYFKPVLKKAKKDENDDLLTSHTCDKESHQLDKFPEEVILKIFGFLDIKDLLIVQVCKRLRSISKDESLWRKVNLSRKFVPTEFLKMVLENGCMYLSLCQAFANFPSDQFQERKAVQLKYLSLSKFRDPHMFNFPVLLECCHSLQKLSIYTPTRNMVDSICNQNYRTLQVLNLHVDEEMELDLLEDILQKCVELTDLNITGDFVTEKLLDCFVKNIPTKITKLSLFQLETISHSQDRFVKDITIRCNKLRTLHLQHCEIGESSLASIIENLDSTLEELDVSYTELWPNDLVQLKSMSKLKTLVCNYMFVNILKPELPHLQIDSDLNSAKFANPNAIFGRKGGMWEIECKRLDLFGNVDCWDSESE